ncbi:MAG TPA: 16S rRNA (guanine(966)-N(2))-methyltransferase RsmD, partial [Candidatus Cryptobacteroides intestinipullorum]|nr:16S rRNA (guanine(966)-N(2))-methyltransferase RsmD [Candidatus Cryptobacteroides intestinipullorum]
LEHPGTFSFRDMPYFVKERKYGNVHFSFFASPDEGQESVSE